MAEVPVPIGAFQLEPEEGRDSSEALLTLNGRLLPASRWPDSATIPGPDTVDLNLQRKAEHDPDDHDHAQHGHAAECGIDDYRANDIPHDQDLQP